MVDAERRDLTVSRQKTDLRPTVTAALGAVAGTAKARKITLQSALDALPPQVLVDKSWFSVALQRVLAEAIDCTPSPGEVKIDWEPGAPGYGWLRVSDGGAAVTVTQGRELAMPFDVRRVQPFAREARTGLGLTIAYALMQMLGSELDIQGTATGAVYRMKLATE